MQSRLPAAVAKIRRSGVCLRKIGSYPRVTCRLARLGAVSAHVTRLPASPALQRPCRVGTRRLTRWAQVTPTTLTARSRPIPVVVTRRPTSIVPTGVVITHIITSAAGVVITHIVTPMARAATSMNIDRIISRGPPAEHLPVHARLPTVTTAIIATSRHRATTSSRPIRRRHGRPTMIPHAHATKVGHSLRDQRVARRIQDERRIRGKRRLPVGTR